MCVAIRTRGENLSPDPNQTLNIGMSDGRIEPFKGTFENQAVQACLGQHFDRPVRQIDLGVDHISHPRSIGVFEKIPKGFATAAIPIIRVCADGSFRAESPCRSRG